MLDVKYIRQNSSKVIQNTKERGMNTDVVEKWLKLDKERNQLVQKIDNLNKERNEIANLLKDDKKRTPKLIAKGKNIKEDVEKVEKDLEVTEAEWNNLLLQIPNIHFDSVPKGKNDAENVEIRRVGEPTKFDFEPKDHLTLGKELDILDFEAGSKVSGSQFYYIKNEGVLLDLALQKFGMDLFAEKGFELAITPDMVKSRYYLGTGYAPRGDEAQTYEIQGEDLGLIATAEVTMAGYFADEILSEKDLPRRFAALSHCFRKEAGAYGKYSKGLYRVHQFTKLEMFAYCKPEESEKIHEEFLAIEEEILQKLEIPYRVLEMCTGDLGSMAAKKYDLEAWMPGRNDYGEVTSTSNCTDFQARNLNIKYKDKDGSNKFVHMLNGTAIVLSRFPIAIIENYQQKDGSIRIPKVLQKYVGKDVIDAKK